MVYISGAQLLAAFPLALVPSLLTKKKKQTIFLCIM